MPDVTNFESVTGFGVKAHVNGEWVEVGADRYMRTLGLEADVFAPTAERLGHEGKTPLYAAIGGRRAANVAVADTRKGTPPRHIAALHEPAPQAQKNKGVPRPRPGAREGRVGEEPRRPRYILGSG